MKVMLTPKITLTPKSLQMVTATMKSEDDYFLAGSNDKPRQCVAKQRHCSANKAVSLGCGITNGHLPL